MRAARRVRGGRVAGVVWLLALAGPARAGEPPQTTTLAPVEVTATPLADAPQPLWQLPRAVQTFDADALREAQSLDLTGYLDTHMAGVSLNAAQNNPLQSDVQFRGFTASPLLGNSQGLVVYVDGVRVNEIFGDTVNWDLIPTQAIARSTLLAGADPVFGLNALGGALSLTTKQGFDASGTRLAWRQGSFGRRQAVLESGGHDGQLAYYVTADRLHEDGWRDLSPTQARHLLANLGWRGTQGRVELGLAQARTDLTGNGATPAAQLRRDPRAVFTAPDETANRLSQVNLHGVWNDSEDLVFSGLLYSRRVRTGSVNGDVTDARPCGDDPGVLCDDGKPLGDQAGQPLPVRYDALFNRGSRRQRALGASLQGVLTRPLFGWDNRLTTGADLQRGQVDYAATVEAGVLLPDREVAAGSGRYLPTQALDVYSATHNRGFYASDTLSLTARLALTASARYNATQVTIADRSGRLPALDGRHRYSRLNPSLGLGWRVGRATALYAGYGESARAPTSVELTCAAPDAPCRLPNVFLADPPLRQVVARSVEAGARGRVGDDARLHWQAGVFRTINRDDILFQATGGASSNQGFFANVGATRRQGFELSGKGSTLDHRWKGSVAYTLLDATYRSGFSESSVAHPDADADGRIAVTRGDRIPGLPRQSLKLGLDYVPSARFAVGVTAVAYGGQYLRGDEANRLRPLGGYALLNLHARWRLNAHVSLRGRIDNVFDRRYASFGMLGDASTVFPGEHDPRFLGPGAPRGGWLELSVDL